MIDIFPELEAWIESIDMDIGQLSDLRKYSKVRGPRIRKAEHMNHVWKSACQTASRDRFECVRKQHPARFGIISFPFAAQNTIRTEGGHPQTPLPFLILGKLAIAVRVFHPPLQHGTPGNR